MAGWDGTRKLPSNWSAIRAHILGRDPDCTLRYTVCTGPSTEVDHIGDRDDHDDSNLRGVCHECHQVRTNAQKAAGHAAWRARAPRLRPKRKHPGLK